MRLYAAADARATPLAEFLASHPRAPGAVRWTMRSAFQRAATVLRTEGVAGLWFTCLGETCYRRLLLLECGTDMSPYARHLPPSSDAIQILDSPADYDAFRVDVPPGEAARLMRAGGRCYALRSAGHIVSATWMFAERAPVPYLGAVMDGGPGTALLYDAWTLPRFRGRGLSPAVARAILSDARAAGCRRVVTAILPENRASLSSRAKVGFRVVGLAGVIRLGGRMHHFLTPTRSWSTHERV